MNEGPDVLFPVVQPMNSFSLLPITEVKVGGVSCTVEQEVCREAKVNSYPSLRVWGLEGVEQGGKMEAREIKGMLEWIKAHIPPSSGDGNAEAGVIRKTITEARGDLAEQAMRGMGRRAEAQVEAAKGKEWTRVNRAEDAWTSVRFAFDNEVFLGTNVLDGSALDSLRGLLHVLNLSFPGATGRKAFGHLLSEVQPLEQISMQEWKSKVVRYIHPLVEDPKVYNYRMCPDDPGSYTCGLWSLFHLLSVKSGEGEVSPAMTMEVIHHFVEYLFGCETCRNHFLASYDSCAFGRCEIGESMDNRALVLWLWRLHNAVNIRTALETTSARPLDLTDVLWPVCEECWDEEEVRNFDTIGPFEVGTVKANLLLFYPFLILLTLICFDRTTPTRHSLIG